MRAIIAGVAACAAAVVFAAPVHADESSYLNELSNAGFYGPVVSWLALGYGVCGMSTQGANIGQLTRFVYANTGPTVGWAGSERVVELAEIFLC